MTLPDAMSTQCNLVGTDMQRKYYKEPVAPIHENGKAAALKARLLRPRTYHLESGRQVLESASAPREEAPSCAGRVPRWMAQLHAETAKATPTSQTLTPKRLKVMRELECARMALISRCFMAWNKAHKEISAQEEGASPDGETQEPLSCNQAESSGFTWELPDISRSFEASDVEVEEDEEDSDEESEAECEEQYEEESDEEELSFIDDFRVTFPKSGSEARSFPSRVHRMKELPAIEEIFGSNPPRLSCSQSQSSLSSSSTNVPSPRDEEHDVMNA
mmetsp:Transcript_67685/g.120193  ORF Transcript_67685/g.120193 Transcript_67685/m.120193 type:complete len:276 (-) Transcript_67685:124-951(-)